MGLSPNTMAATLLLPSMAIVILNLLLSPTTSNAAVNQTASNRCENCLVGDLNFDSEFLMESETSRMLLDSNNFETFNTIKAEKQSVPECDRPPRYDSCLGQKNNIPIPENCDVRNRGNPC